MHYKLNLLVLIPDIKKKREIKKKDDILPPLTCHKQYHPHALNNKYLHIGFDTGSSTAVVKHLVNKKYSKISHSLKSKI